MDGELCPALYLGRPGRPWAGPPRCGPWPRPAQGPAPPALDHGGRGGHPAVGRGGAGARPICGDPAGPAAGERAQSGHGRGGHGRACRGPHTGLRPGVNGHRSLEDTWRSQGSRRRSGPRGRRCLTSAALGPCSLGTGYHYQPLALMGHGCALRPAFRPDPHLGLQGSPSGGARPTARPRTRTPPPRR